jgi:DNA-binding CsgD family transcriptional regulator
MIDIVAAQDAILRAQRRFHANVLDQLYAEQQDRVLALAREQRYALTYARRMQIRLRLGLREVRNDMLARPADRDRRVRQVMELERVYLARHIAASGRRLRADREMWSLKLRGERGAVWLIDESLRTHTADCLAMAGKWWPWRVLDQINPGNRHAGCGCRLVGREIADARGIPYTLGYLTGRVRTAILEGLRADDGDAALREAVYVPLRPGVGGNPWHDEGSGRFVSVHGDIHKSLHGRLRRYLAAVERGDVASMRQEHDALRREAIEKLSGPRVGRARDVSLRTIDRVHAAALHPSGARSRYGTTVNIGGERIRIPTVPAEIEGRSSGWAGARGTRFQWTMPAGALGRDTGTILAKLQQSRRFRAAKRGDHFLLETAENLSPQDAHGAAISIERHFNQLRRVRTTRPGEPLNDDTPLDLRADLSSAGERRHSRYAHVSRQALGDAAELALPDVARRLKELGVIDSADNRASMTFVTDKSDKPPLDWQIGEFGIEVKAQSFRGLTTGVSAATGKTGGVSVTPAQRAEKLKSARLNGLKPALSQHIVDFDAGVTHVFLYRYEGEWDGDEWVPAPGAPQAYSPVRLPQDATRALVEGRATPGDQFIPYKGTEGQATLYVGTFSLRANPLAARDQGRDLSPRELRQRIEAPPGPSADVLPRDATVRPAQAPARGGGAQAIAEKRGDRRLALAQRDAEIVKLAQAGGATQGDIARQLGVSQATVSGVLRRNGIKMGRGTRNDRRRAA